MSLNGKQSTTTKPHLPQLIDATMMNCFRACPQKFHLEFHQGYRPKGVSIDLHAGGCFAIALEEVRSQVFGHGKSLADALVIAHAKFMVAWGDLEPPEWKPGKTRDNTWYAVEEYFKAYSPLTDFVQPYMTDDKPTLEYRFSIGLEPVTETEEEGGFPSHPIDPEASFHYGGKFDMLGHMQHRPVILDEKTTRGIGKDWADQWNLRSQFIGYVWACQQVGIDIDTAVIRGIALLKTEIKFAEAIRPYSNFLVKRWYEQLRRDLWRMRRCWEKGYFDFNLGETCTAYGNCAFMTVCGSPNPDSWLTEFDIRHWNPLDHNPDPQPSNPALVR